MKKVRFQGVPHAPSIVIPHAVAEGAEPSVKPWAPGEIRELPDAVAAKLVSDYATAGALKSPAFLVVEDGVVTKPAAATVTK